MSLPPASSTPAYRLELHCHTVASMDGLISFESLLRTATAVGLDAIAITDHDTIAGALRLRDLARQRGESLQIIVGEERTLADGSHLIGLFLEEPIVSVDVAGMLREVEAQNGLCLIPHPFRRKDGLLRNGLEPLQHFAGRTAGFELFSAKCSAAENRQAAELLPNTALGPFVGSDAHYECDLGESLNEITWTGGLRSSLQEMLGRTAPCRLWGKPQALDDRERTYAPAYYRIRRIARLPRPLVPLAKECYRRYRNFKFGVGRKPLREIYRHA
jgi:predicted metal-dependent phosphoesterase TrpH